VSQVISREYARDIMRGGRTYVFLSLLDTRRDLVIGCKGFVLVGIDLVFAKNRKCRLDIQLLDANLA
jgi:hypothetical protein